MESRVKLLRKQLNISQEAFGLKLGVTGAGISKIENGQRNLTEQMLLLISKEYNVSESWLRRGEGGMFKERLPYEIEQIADTYDLDEFDIKIIQEYIKLDSENRKVIKEYIRKIALLDNPANNKDTAARRDGTRDNGTDLLTDGSLNNEVLRCAEEA